MLFEAGFFEPAVTHLVARHEHVTHALGYPGHADIGNAGLAIAVLVRQTLRVAAAGRSGAVRADAVIAACARVSGYAACAGCTALTSRTAGGPLAPSGRITAAAAEKAARVGAAAGHGCGAQRRDNDPRRPNPASTHGAPHIPRRRARTNTGRQMG